MRVISITKVKRWPGGPYTTRQLIPENYLTVRHGHSSAPHLWKSMSRNNCLILTTLVKIDFSSVKCSITKSQVHFTQLLKL